MFLVPRCRVAAKQKKAWKPSKLSLSAIMFCVFFNDRLLRTEMGETKVDGSGWDGKTDCKRQEGKSLKPRVRSQHRTYESLMKVHAGAAVQDSGHTSADCRYLTCFEVFWSAGFFSVRDKCFDLMKTKKENTGGSLFPCTKEKFRISHIRQLFSKDHSIMVSTKNCNNIIRFS